MLVVAAKRYLYHAGYYILNSSAIKLCDAWQAPLSLPLALSSHKRGMLAPLPSQEEQTIESQNQNTKFFERPFCISVVGKASNDNLIYTD